MENKEEEKRQNKDSFFSLLNKAVFVPTETRNQEESPNYIKRENHAATTGGKLQKKKIGADPE